MKVTVTKLTDERLMQRACSFTINKESKMPLENIYRCQHSPIRTQLFWIELEDIFTFCSVHLVRHSLGVTHFVKSNREDRVGCTGDTGRRHPVNHAMLLSAEALINICRKRLCGKTSKETTEIMLVVKEAIREVDPALYPHLVRECKFRNGVCPELKCCGNLYLPK